MTDQPPVVYAVLKPGRELDEAIARAMGWKLISGFSKEYPTYSYWEKPNGGECETHELPPISTDSATAIPTLEQLCKPVEEGGRGWDGYRLAYTDKVHWAEIIPMDYIYSSGISLAHAAALAILAALEAEKRLTVA